MIHDSLELPTREQTMANSAASASAKGEQTKWQKPRISGGHIWAQCAETYNIEGVNASAHAKRDGDKGIIYVLRETRTRLYAHNAQNRTTLKVLMQAPMEP